MDRGGTGSSVDHHCVGGVARGSAVWGRDRHPAHDVDANHASLGERGVDTDDILRWEGVPPMFAFRDQDGHGLEIVEQP
jgi:hypothetical protein